MATKVHTFDTFLFLIFCGERYFAAAARSPRNDARSMTAEIQMRVKLEHHKKVLTLCEAGKEAVMDMANERCSRSDKLAAKNRNLRC